MKTLTILLQANLGQSKPIALIEILILLLVAIVIGWWLARLVVGGRVKDLKADIEAKRMELVACQQAKKQDPVAPVPAPVVVAPVAVATEFVVAEPPVSSLAEDPVVIIKTTPDDLTIVEGIGPKIKELLHSNGVLSFAQLAASTPEQLKAILDQAGPNYRIHDPSTWAAQALMAAEGKWDELRKWQDELYKGKVK
jgi:predicted flap endonuclease-1-like 5' DNA nuclease